MKILFSSRPAYGHLYPMMPMASAARDAGHDVAFATAGPFVARLEALGFPTHAAGLSMETARGILYEEAGVDAFATGDDGRPDLDFGGRLFIDVLARRSVTDIAPLLDRHAPDLVVYEQGEMGAAIAAHLAGIPAVCHAISPRMPPAALARVVGSRLDRLWARHGRTPPPLDVTIGDAYLDIVPDGLQLPSFLAEPARIPVRPVPWAEPGLGLPAWVGSRRRPLVYLTLGTVVGTGDNLRPAIDGLSTLDADVLVALGSASGAALGELAGNVHVEALVDQPRAIEHADLVVHHGGTGTMLGALAHAKRQVVLPKGADQFFNADALAARGLAQVLEPAAASPDAVAEAARAALEAPVPPAVAGARAEIVAMPEPAEALATLLDRVVGALRS